MESRDILLKLGTGHFNNISSHIEWLLGWLYGLILNNYPVTYSFIGFFLDLRWKKYHLDFDSKLKDWTNGYLIENWGRLSQEYTKSYRIAFRVALWLVWNKYPATYSFIGLFFGVTVSKRCIECDTKLKDWIKRYLIETWHRLFQGCFKSYRIAFRVALWLDFEQLSSYLFISRCLFRAAISKCYMEFDTKLEDWINRYLIQTYHRLSQENFKSYRITFRVALWLVFK